MTDPRTSAFAGVIDAFKADGKANPFDDPGNITALHQLLDAWGLSREPTPDKVPDDYFPMLAQIESGNRPYIKAKTSSASGLYQFIRDTWIGEGGKWGNDLAQAFGGLHPSEAEQLMRAKSFTEKNAAILRAKSIPINRASLYAAHFLGAGMAVKLIGSDVNVRADLIAGAAATKANPSILKEKSVGQFLSWLHKKTGEWAR